MATLGPDPRRSYGVTTRASCATEACFASFDGAPARADEVRHCNRTGPDGGHANKWDGANWQAVTGRMQHDR